MVHAEIAPLNKVCISAFTGVYGGRLGHCTIGRFCSIAPGVDIASDQHPTDWLSSSMAFYVPNIHGWENWMKEKGMPAPEPHLKFKSNAGVSIGNDVWLGKNVIVKSGVVIGDGAIVGAGAVVTADVPPYAIVAGIPARIVRMRFDERLIEKLISIRWWKYNIFELSGLDPSRPEEAVERIGSAIASRQLREMELKRFDLNGREVPNDASCQGLG